MRRFSLPVLLLSLPLAACGGGGTSSAGGNGAAIDADQVKARAPVIGELVRAASVCGLPISATAQDRAARIEAAALELATRDGGEQARDDYLRSVQPPHFAPRRRGQDRSRYCGQKQPDMERMESFLSGPDGAALAQQAEAVRAAADH